MARNRVIIQGDDEQVVIDVCSGAGEHHPCVGVNITLGRETKILMSISLAQANTLISELADVLMGIQVQCRSVWIDGEYGDDRNDGSEYQPIKTLVRAEELSSGDSLRPR